MFKHSVTHIYIYCDAEPVVTYLYVVKRLSTPSQEKHMWCRV